MPDVRIHEGTDVILNVPNNEFVHGQEATVIELTEWGAHVTTSVGSGRFRALHSEMVVKGDSWPEHEPLSAYTVQRAVTEGYTGGFCDHCGSHRVKRTGPCSTCQDCGMSGGCA